MEKVRPWCGQPSDRGRLKNRTEHGLSVCPSVCVPVGHGHELCKTAEPIKICRFLGPRNHILDGGAHLAPSVNTIDLCAAATAMRPIASITVAICF